MNTTSPRLTDTPPAGHKWHQNATDDLVAVPEHVVIGSSVTLMAGTYERSRNGAALIKFSRYVELKDGVTIYPGANIESCITIGEYAVINTNAHLLTSCEIGAHVQVGKRATIGAHAKIGRGAHIGEGAYIGEAVIVRPGTHVPENWYVPSSTTCTVVVNPGKTQKDTPVVLVVPR